MALRGNCYTSAVSLGSKISKSITKNVTMHQCDGLENRCNCSAYMQYIAFFI